VTALPSSRVAQLQDLTAPLARVFREEAQAADRQETLSVRGVQALRDSGYAALTVPASLGGLGATLHEFALAQEDLGRADAITDCP